MQIGRESLILTRNRKREPRAFFNVCRHRGARVCSAESGQAQRSFQCPYHAWTYDLNGKLIAAPNLTRMPDVGREEYGLRTAQVREWLGYIWVCVAEEPPSFEDTVMGAVRSRLGDIESIDHYSVDTLEVGRRIVYDVKANWKLIVENFMECYHCATIHPELTEVLPEFADGFAAQYFVGHGAVFGEDVQGFTVDGSEGVEKLPGVTDDQDRRYYAVTVRPNVFVNLVPDHVIFHRMFPHRTGPHHRRMRLAVPARGHRLRRRPVQVDRAVRPGQPAGLRGVRAVPVGHRFPGVRQGRGTGAQRTPHRRFPELGGRRRRRLTGSATTEGRQFCRSAEARPPLRPRLPYRSRCGTASSEPTPNDKKEHTCPSRFRPSSPAPRTPPWNW